MPLLVRKKLVSADCACAGALARADMAASAKHAGEMILAKRFIWFLPVVFWFVGINTSRRPLFQREMKRAFRQRKRRRGTSRGASIVHCAGDQLVCWIAESSQSAPRRRAKVHTSVASIGVSLPETRRPVVRSRVLSTSEKRIATLAKSVSPSRQASARSPCSSLTSVTLLTSLFALFASRSLEK